MAPPKNADLPRGTVVTTSGSKQLKLQIRVRPLPTAVSEFLLRHSGTIKRIYARKRHALTDNVETSGDDTPDTINSQEATADGATSSRNTLSVDEFKRELSTCFGALKEDKEVWAGALAKISEFGPRKTGANILFDATPTGRYEKLFAEGSNNRPTRDSGLFSDKISYAFQLATSQGPLCREPVQGVAVFIEDVTLEETGEEEQTRLSGEVIRLVRDAVWQGFLDWSPRIMLAMYSCEIQATTEVLGRVYGVVTRRRGRILSETMKEGTSFFTILSLLPVAESFGFSDEIRKRTSGAASPQLIFTGFEMLDQDPFWVPATEEELEDLGELADKENVAKRYVDSVRSRKGMVVAGKKLVKDAEKQKTLKR
ncbi:hypothetical protein FQN49_002747 [Arthroderma sp. PD_2]|nr:hypothetical protein FQN49_002747 [Arthroderma sp. PD_2]